MAKLLAILALLFQLSPTAEAECQTGMCDETSLLQTKQEVKAGANRTEADDHDDAAALAQQESLSGEILRERQQEEASADAALPFGPRSWAGVRNWAVRRDYGPRTWRVPLQGQYATWKAFHGMPVAPAESLAARRAVAARMLWAKRQWRQYQIYSRRRWGEIKWLNPWHEGPHPWGWVTRADQALAGARMVKDVQRARAVGEWKAARGALAMDVAANVGANAKERALWAGEAVADRALLGGAALGPGARLGAAALGAGELGAAGVGLGARAALGAGLPGAGFRARAALGEGAALSDAAVGAAELGAAGMGMGGGLGLGARAAMGGGLGLGARAAMGGGLGAAAAMGGGLGLGEAQMALNAPEFQAAGLAAADAEFAGAGPLGGGLGLGAGMAGGLAGEKIRLAAEDKMAEDEGLAGEGLGFELGAPRAAGLGLGAGGLGAGAAGLGLGARLGLGAGGMGELAGLTGADGIAETLGDTEFLATGAVPTRIEIPAVDLSSRGSEAVHVEMDEHELRRDRAVEKTWLEAKLDADQAALKAAELEDFEEVSLKHDNSEGAEQARIKAAEAKGAQIEYYKKRIDADQAELDALTASMVQATLM